MEPITQTISTLYFTSGGQFAPFLPGDADRPDQYYDPRVKDLNGVARRMFSSGRTMGESSLGSGVVTLSNYDGGLDYLITYGYSGRNISIYYGDSDVFADYRLYFDGVMEAMEFTYSKGSSGSIVITVRSKKMILDKDIQVNYYLGTNSGSTGNEGETDSGIKNKLKPLLFGECLNVSPILVNAAGLRYQVHDGAINSVDAVYLNGSAMTADVSDPPAGGKYYADLTTGIITLGTAPTNETVTCDIKGAKFSGSYYKKVGDLAKWIVKTYGGLTDGDIDSTAITQLNTDAPQTLGIFVPGGEAPKAGEKSSVSIASILDQLCDSVGAYWMFDNAGKFTMGMLKVPDAETSILSVDQNDIIDIEMIQNQDDNKGVPLSKLTLQAVKNWTTQEATELAGVVLTDQKRKEWLKNEYRDYIATNATNQTIYNADLAKMVKQTLLTLDAEATTEVTRLMTIYGSKRLFFRIVLDQSIIPATLDIGKTITITFPRFGLGSGDKFYILGVTYNYPKLNQVELEIYG
jgi:hypothetical protein